MKSDIEEEKDKGGRPPIVLTEEQKTELGLLAQYITTEMIADHFGFCRASFFNLVNRDEEVGNIYRKARAKTGTAIAQNLIKAALGGCATRQIFYAKTKLGWSETQKHELSGPNGGPIQSSRPLKDMPRKEAEAELEKYLDIPKSSTPAN